MVLKTLRFIQSPLIHLASSTQEREGKELFLTLHHNEIDNLNYYIL